MNKITIWIKQWRIILNGTKSVAKYLAMTLDVKLRWKAQIKKKEKTEPKTWKNVLVSGKNLFPLSVQQTTYNQVIKPVETCAIQHWGCARKNNMDIIQRFQNKSSIVDAPWY